MRDAAARLAQAAGTPPPPASTSVTTPTYRAPPTPPPTTQFSSLLIQSTQASQSLQTSSQSTVTTVQSTRPRSSVISPASVLATKHLRASSKRKPKGTKKKKLSHAASVMSDEQTDDGQHLHLGQTGLDAASVGPSTLLDMHIPCRFASEGCGEKSKIWL